MSEGGEKKGRVAFVVGGPGSLTAAITMVLGAHVVDEVRRREIRAQEIETMREAGCTDQDIVDLMIGYQAKIVDRSGNMRDATVRDYELGIDIGDRLVRMYDARQQIEVTSREIHELMREPYVRPDIPTYKTRDWTSRDYKRGKSKKRRR